jgi:hypothetical protein
VVVGADAVEGGEARQPRDTIPPISPDHTAPAARSRSGLPAWAISAARSAMASSEHSGAARASGRLELVPEHVGQHL